MKAYSVDKPSETHYRCPGKYNDCLPTNRRCNGFYECVNHADEDGREEMTCPRFCRCSKFTMCVHADHLCDSWPLCPLLDYEWLCDIICPASCICQGYAFLCPQPFSGLLFLHSRSLDAQGLIMSPPDLKNNAYLIN